MTTLEARIADAISWKKLPFGGVSDLHIQLDANAAHAVAKLLAPVIREAQAEAWQEGYIKSCFDHGDGGKLHGADNINPYRSNDE